MCVWVAEHPHSLSLFVAAVSVKQNLYVKFYEELLCAQIEYAEDIAAALKSHSEIFSLAEHFSSQFYAFFNDLKMR